MKIGAEKKFQKKRLEFNLTTAANKNAPFDTRKSNSIKKNIINNSTI